MHILCPVRYDKSSWQFSASPASFSAARILNSAMQSIVVAKTNLAHARATTQILDDRVIGAFPVRCGGILLIS
jgi:hypothetical protein